MQKIKLSNFWAAKNYVGNTLNAVITYVPLFLYSISGVWSDAGSQILAGEKKYSRNSRLKKTCGVEKLDVVERKEKLSRPKLRVKLIGVSSNIPKYPLLLMPRSWRKLTLQNSTLKLFGTSCFHPILERIHHETSRTYPRNHFRDVFCRYIIILLRITWNPICNRLILFE